MSRRLYECFLIIFFLVFTVSAHAVLVSSGARSSGMLATRSNVVTSAPPKQLKNEDRRQVISEYTQQVLYNTMLEQTTDVMQRFIQQSNIDLMPNLIQVSIQQVAMQAFKQDQTMGMIRDIFDQCVDIGLDDFDKGKGGVEVQEHIRQTAQVELRALVENRAYQEIMRKIVENSYQNQQQMIAQQVYQQRAQQIAQQQAAMQRAAQEQYMQQMQQQMIQQQQQMMIQQQQQQMLQQQQQQRAQSPFGR